MARNTQQKLAEIRTIASAEAPRAAAALTPVRAEIVALAEDGTVSIRAGDQHLIPCDVIQDGSGMVLAPGDSVLAMVPATAKGRGVIVGRIGPYRPPEPAAHLTLEATEGLTLKCGDATLDLRADGKAVLKGDDVLIRAKGLQRIKAGSVSIN